MTIWRDSPFHRGLHVTRAAQQRFGLPPADFGLYGHLMALDPARAAEWSALVARGQGAGGPESPPGFSTGQLLASAALHELMHALLAVVREAPGPHAGTLQRAAAAVWGRLGESTIRTLGNAFGQTYVPASAAGFPATHGADYVAARAADADEVLLEELLLLELAYQNPALGPLGVLFHSPEFRSEEAYAPALEVLLAEFGRPPGGAAASAPVPAGVPAPAAQGVRSAAGSLLALLLAPQRAAPDSLQGQLQAALELWGPMLRGRFGPALTSALRALDLLKEEAPPPAPTLGPPGPGPLHLDSSAPVVDGEPEAYSQDSAWMPGVVLVAKSTYVWLAQLSQRYGHEVRTLDAVPNEALAELAQQGFNALWLIGVWWRSDASRTLKRLKGQQDALASAYSVREYVVAPELGGEEALARLQERAASYGIRLASDMVPNHTAIDSTWLMERPEWFVQVESPPYDGYSFTGPDLSSEPRVSVRIEDGYYDASDAAVVFQRVDNEGGGVRYVYHGNDGTALPWNDTAQLDFLNPEVRRAVMDATVAVARRFPLVRLDAAMTLTRRHVRRLWHPKPGEGGAVPSRSALAVPQAEFDRLMPREFWRELVDRLAVEAPGTMLLAEAFWLMEAYFVRSLGMHRVYNSAFMHMTMHEQNAQHRRYLKRYLEQAPPVLERFVNYMSNPDEESAAEQYGHGDKAFGVATLMATLPGLPMFGHGQVEGLHEKYGMEFARPRMDERPRPDHVQRHQRQIAPLLARRTLFAGSRLFRLFDLVAADGQVLEDVFVYSNGSAGERVLVAYNNSPQRVRGAARLTAPVKATNGEPVSQTLLQALALEPAGEVSSEVSSEVSGEAAREAGVAVFTDLGGGELRVGLAELAASGLHLELGPYESKVFIAVRTEPEVASAASAVSAGRKRRAPAAGALLAGPRGVAARRRSARRRR